MNEPMPTAMKTTMYGTSYFVSRFHAIQYYRKQNETARDVDRKLSEGLIHIGLPPTRDGQRVVLIDDYTRYAIVEETKEVTTK